jgi:chemotaxis protein MotC
VIAHPALRTIALIFVVAMGLTGAAVSVAASEHGESSHEAKPEEPKADGPKTEEVKADGEPSSVHLWPEMPAVDADKQPYVLIRQLRAVQDEVAAGSAAAHEKQRKLMGLLGSELLETPPAVWDDVRNVRSAIFFVLSGGNPAVLRQIDARGTHPMVERRLIKGALAYGEGRTIDALGLLNKIEARNLDPALSGIVALIQGTLSSKKEPQKAIRLFDEARLLAPGTLVEEAALRQQILLLAREGELERFDILAKQYSRRFPNSLFARGFQRQFFAGVARQNYKHSSEWKSRTETELMKVPAAERVGLYLAMAEEATKNGNIDIARFAAGKARELSRTDSRSFQRASLFEGAALVATEDYEQGITLLNGVDEEKLAAPDKEIRASALALAGAVGKWPDAPAELDEPEPEAVGRAQALLTEVDSLLGGSPK